MVKVLEIEDDSNYQMLEWLEIYLGCIPHSTYDETYRVFCIIV